jgi:hypothetical protein
MQNLFGEPEVKKLSGTPRRRYENNTGIPRYSTLHLVLFRHSATADCLFFLFGAEMLRG